MRTLLVTLCLIFAAIVTGAGAMYHYGLSSMPNMPQINPITWHIVVSLLIITAITVRITYRPKKAAMAIAR